MLIFKHKTTMFVYTTVCIVLYVCILFNRFNNHTHGCYMAYKRQGLVEPSNLANSNLVNSKISIGQN